MTSNTNVIVIVIVSDAETPYWLKLRLLTRKPLERSIFATERYWHHGFVDDHDIRQTLAIEAEDNLQCEDDVTVVYSLVYSVLQGDGTSDFLQEFVTCIRSSIHVCTEWLNKNVTLTKWLISLIIWHLPQAYMYLKSKLSRLIWHQQIRVNAKIIKDINNFVNVIFLLSHLWLWSQPMTVKQEVFDFSREEYLFLKDILLFLAPVQPDLYNAHF